MQTYIVQQAHQYVEDLLKTHIGSRLPYHNITHTLDVYNAVNQIIQTENIDSTTGEILNLAALFHDTGFIKVYDGHEAISAEIAKEFLQKNNYPNDRIELIENLILSTHINHIPRNYLEGIIRDADMLNLGRDDFFTLGKLVRQETSEHLKKDMPYKIWFQNSLKLILQYPFYTPSVVANHSKKRWENIAELQRRIKELS